MEKDIIFGGHIVPGHCPALMSLEAMTRNMMETHIGEMTMSQCDLKYPLIKNQDGHLTLPVNPTPKARHS
eukprot:3163190-Heterocapsa_arctica.AAC.1